MTPEELEALAIKIKNNEASPEEKDLFFREFTKIIESMNGDLKTLVGNN